MNALNLETLRARLQTANGWEGKSRLLVQLAQELPPFDPQARTDAHRIPGCESQVWLQQQWQEEQLQLALDSDSRIIKGLLVLVFAAFAGRDRQSVLAFDFPALVNELGLARLLTGSRSNSLRIIVERIRQLAASGDDQGSKKA